MAAAAKVTRQAWDDQARELMAPCADVSPWALLETPAQMFDGADLWQFDCGGALALVATRTLQLQRGRLCEVVGMRSIGDRLHAHQLPAIDHLARDVYGADLLSMFTRHAHLVRACERAGWTDVARVAVKPLKVQ